MCIRDSFGSPDLRMHYDNIRQMVKEKTGRAMQEKERERKGKNGKIVKIAWCSPIPVSYTHLDVYKRQDVERVMAERNK